jgi:hypothetical protein
MFRHALRRRTRRAVATLTATLVAALVLATPVAARVSVDPGSLNPPPPEFINPQCGWSGRQVVCAFDYTFDAVDVPTGVVCDGNELLETTNRHVFGHRYYDSDLNIVGRDFAERIDGVLYDPVTRVSIHWTGHDQGFETYSVPGDRSTGTLTNTGAGIRVDLDSGRSYVLFAGRSVENFDTGEFDWMGSHPDFGFCEAIAANS